MQFSIHGRFVGTMLLLVAAVGLAIGWIGLETVGALVEQRLVHDNVRHAAALITEMHLPLTPALLRNLGQVLNASMAAGPVAGGTIQGSTLAPAQEQELAMALRGDGSRRVVDLGGIRYRVGCAEFGTAVFPTENRGSRLYLLYPEARIRDARRQAGRWIILVTASVTAVAGLVGWWLAHVLTRPVRELATELDRLSAQITDRPEQPLATPEAPAGPAEVRQFATAFSRLAAQLAASRQALERNARLAAIGRLAASVVHELRNPLSGIKMSARLLADRLVRDGRSEKSCEILAREVERMDVYLEELLGLASGESDPVTGRGTPLDLSRCPAVRLADEVRSVLALLAGRLAHAKVRATFDVAPDLDPGDFRGDAGRLRQVLLNLLLNAIEAMPSGGVLQVVLARTATGDCRCEVRDRGAGVQLRPGQSDPFEPFVSTKPKGTGLGLFICRQIITAHHGRIGYENSATGGGCCFWFELPVTATSGDTRVVDNE